MYKKNGPHVVKEDPGKKRYCACGKTETPPYCDGNHTCKGIDIEPFEVFVETPRTVALCGCGKSKNLPYCDGSHECYRQI